MKESNSMTTQKNTKNSTILFALALAIGAAACGSDASVGDTEGAYLTIQGDAQLFLEPGYQRNLAVQYTDGQGNALTGEVSFEILGEARGTTIDRDYGATNAQGEASLTLYAGEQETVIRVKASADYAASVEWTVSVTEGATPLEMDIRGKYELDSDFDIINGLPGSVGSVANTFADLTDGPNDPATYILDELLEGQTSFVATAVNALRPAIDGMVNDVIIDNAPGVVDDLLELGNAFGQVSRQFGIVSTMDIKGDSIEANNMVAIHTTQAFSFQLDGETFIFTMDELGVDEETIENITVGYDSATGKVDFAQHTVPVHYGGFLALALEEVIIPRIDSSASSLQELLANKIDCEGVGVSLEENVGIFGESFYEGACEIAIEAVASIVMEELREIDEHAPVNMLIDGIATVKDPSGDGKADSMTKGNWSGAMEYDGTMGDLADNANPFAGARMASPN
ncbi:MAG: hypothetical protein GY811_00200 [Myxococcales bacterium]|nr:hypothetical protein [Myxococcales bacterium]